MKSTAVRKLNPAPLEVLPMQGGTLPSHFGNAGQVASCAHGDQMGEHRVGQ